MGSRLGDDRKYLNVNVPSAPEPRAFLRVITRIKMVQVSVLFYNPQPLSSLHNNAPFKPFVFFLSKNKGVRLGRGGGVIKGPQLTGGVKGLIECLHLRRTPLFTVENNRRNV